MTADDAILVFIDPFGEFEGWLQLAGGAVAARGSALEALPGLGAPARPEQPQLVAVVPGDAVTIHWLEVPGGLAPAQAVAAARLIASEVSAQPLTDIHVAVGPESADHSLRVVALLPALAMAGWLGKLQAQGLDPDLMIPESLLLLPPDEGFVRYVRGPIPLYRGRTDAFAIEPELAEVITAGAPVREIDHAAFEAGLVETLARPPVNLRQGVFAKRRRWKMDGRLAQRLAALAAGILLVTLAIQVSQIMKYTYAADALEIEADRIAATALPGGERLTDASAQLEQRLSRLRGPGVGYGALATSVFGAVRAVPNAQLTGMVYAPDGSLSVTVQGDSPAALSALEQRIEAGGLLAEAGPLRTGGGRPTAEIRVRGQ